MVLFAAGAMQVASATNAPSAADKNTLLPLHFDEEPGQLASLEKYSKSDKTQP